MGNGSGHAVHAGVLSLEFVVKPRISILASPVLCLTLLGGIVVQDRTHLKPYDVEPYHAAARAAIEDWPKTIADGEWTTSKDEGLPPSAEQLLHPNCVIDRLYTSGAIRVNGLPAQASLLIVQCKDSRDMLGHYPPICYPAAGRPQNYAAPFNIGIGPKTIHGMEYHFVYRRAVGEEHPCVYNFFVVPGKGIVADMDGLQQAGKDYQRRYYGAAQFQVVMDADYPQDLREKIFKTIIGANLRAFAVLNTVEMQ